MRDLKSILCVDNQAGVRESTKAYLEAKGYQVFTAGSSEEAKTILDKERIYLAIIDVRLKDDNDPHDVTGLDLAAELDPPVTKLILTGFPTEELIRQALVKRYLDQVAPAEDVVSKRDGPRRLLDVVERIFDEKIYKRMNLDLDLQWKNRLTLRHLALPLLLSLQTISETLLFDEVEELLRRLFVRESKIYLYPMSPGRGGGTVALVTPVYQQAVGSPVVVKLGPVEEIENELSNYREYVEPYAHRYATVVLGEPVRTHHLMGFKMLFVGCSTEEAHDFNNLYADVNVSALKLQKVLTGVFSQSCRVWYQNKRSWLKQDKNAGGLERSFHKRMMRELSLSIDARSEVAGEINRLLNERTFRHVAFSKAKNNSILVNVDGATKELVDPLFLLTHHTDALSQPTFSAITHGDMNGRNILVDDTGTAWLIDFDRTGWGPALRDVAELETAVKFELIHSLRSHDVSLVDLLEFEEIVVLPDSFNEEIDLPAHLQQVAFERALAAIQTIRAAAENVAETKQMNEYYAMLLLYALKILTWRGISSLDARVNEMRQRHALFSAALLSSKFVPTSPEAHETIIV